MSRSVIPLPRLFRRNRLAFYRVVMGIKQRELASQLGITPEAISNWEQDKATPRKEHAHRVAEILQIPVGKLWPNERY